jgi:two-component system sensor histidine kinase YesM
MNQRLRNLFTIFHYDIPFAKKLNRVYLLIFILPLLLINFYLASYVARLLEQQLRYSAAANYQQTLQYLEAELSYYDTLAFTLSRIGEFQYLYQNRRNIRDISANEVNILKRELETAIYTAISRVSIAGFSVYLDGELGILANQNTFFGFNDIEDDIWFKEMMIHFKRHRRSFLLCPPAWKTANEKKVVSFARTIFSKDNYWELFGLVQVDIPLDTFMDILDKNNSHSGSISYIINYENEIVVASDMFPDEGASLRGLFPYNPLEISGAWQNVRINGQYYITRQAPVGKYRINLITLIPINAIRADSRTLQFVVFLILLALSIMTGIFFSREFSVLAARIQLIIKYMQATNDGILTPISEYAGKDEVGQLITNYNKMVENMRSFAEYKYQSGMELKSYELQVLQEQINPHFLYNALEMINWLAKNGHNERVSAAVDALAQFYQAALGRGKNIVPLQNELTHVQAYIDLQNMRFENVLQYRCVFPEEALACMVPRTILQPIVENAILHGILEKECGAGSITVAVELEGENLLIEVQDDGVGMSAGQTEKLNAGAISGGYGAVNVASRIRLMYGPDYGIHYQSEKGKGTCVQFTLPAQIVVADLAYAGAH